MSTDDARVAPPGPDWATRRIPPGHAPVWVRIAGEWRKGRVVEWVIYVGNPGDWQAVITADGPQDLPWQGRYIYDGESIRARHDDITPGE